MATNKTGESGVTDGAVSHAQFNDALVSLARRFDEELFAKTKEQLEEYWFFLFDRTISIESNIYNFHKKLDLYGNRCRRWEEHFNGSCCVVERVRDEYLWPKIQQLAIDLRAKIAAEAGPS